MMGFGKKNKNLYILVLMHHVARVGALDKRRCVLGGGGRGGEGALVYINVAGRC